VTKAGDHYERYYDSMEKKSAALKDDRYVYPGDPVRAECVLKSVADLTRFTGHPCGY